MQRSMGLCRVVAEHRLEGVNLFKCGRAAIRVPSTAGFAKKAFKCDRLASVVLKDNGCVLSSSLGGSAAAAAAASTAAAARGTHEALAADPCATSSGSAPRSTCLCLEPSTPAEARRLNSSHSTCPSPNANPPLAGIGSPHNTALPHWARQFLRQVKTLPQGKLALHQLLISVQQLMDKTAAVPHPHHSKVIKAYLLLAAVDIVERAWRHRSQQLHLSQAKLAHGSKRAQAVALLQQQAQSAMAGCRYLRLEAAAALATCVHEALDGQGYRQLLDYAAVPSSRDIGISFAKLLQHHLNGQPAAQEDAVGHSQAGHLDYTIKPAPSCPSSSSACFTEANVLQDLDCPAYLATLADASLSGSWEFGYWDGSASFVPAPHSKGFSTMQLQQLLSSEVVLASLKKGVWGRALLAAATLSGVTVGRQQPVAVGRQQPVHDDAWVVAAGGRAVAVARRSQMSSRHPIEDNATTTSNTSNSSSDELAISVDFLAQLYAAAAYVAHGERKSLLLPVA